MGILDWLDRLDRRLRTSRPQNLPAHEQTRAMRKILYLPVVLVVLGLIGLALVLGVPKLLSFAPVIPGLFFIVWAERRT